MKNCGVAILLICFQFAFFVRADEGQKCVVTFPVVETPKNEYREASKIEPGVIVYPREVLFGDSIFILHTAKNVGTNKSHSMASPGIFDFQYSGLDYTFTAEGIDEKYNPMWESPFLGHADYFYPEIFLEPGETGTTSGIELELPPLEDWDAPFWNAIRDHLPPEGRKVTLTFSRPTGEKQRSDLGVVEILIKPRPDKEMEQLQAWFDSMNKDFMPVERNLLYGYPVKARPEPKEIPQVPLSQRKEKPEETVTETKTDAMQLGGKSYPISSFIRFPHRKPPREQAPTVLEGWRKLRDSFSEGSIRTELEWVVLKMEYLDAYKSDDPQPQIGKRDEIVQWIQSQPDFQQPWWAKRTLSVASLDREAYDKEAFDKDRYERGIEFLRVLYPMLHSINQENTRRLIPEMKAEDEKRRDDWKISQGVSEKEKAEGFRFWFLKTGKLLCKGKLIAIGKSQAMIKEDYGSTYTNTIETLSEDDQKYIEEKRNDSRWTPDMEDGNVRMFLDKENERELTESQKSDTRKPIAKGNQLRVFPSAGGDVYCLMYSHDGSQILTSGKDQTIKLWNAKTGALVQTFRGHDSAVKSASISPDGKYALTGADQDRTARLWEIITGNEIRKFPISNWNHNQTAFSPDGKYLFTTVDTRSITLFSVETGESLMEFRGHGNYIRSIAISPDGRRLVTGSEDKTVILWDIDTGKYLWVAKLDGRATAVAFTPDGKYLVAGASDKGIRLLDAETGNIEKNISNEHNGHNYSFAITPNGKELISSVFHSMIHVYSLPDGKFLRGFRAHEYTVTDVSVSPDGKQFATCGIDGSVKIWDINTSQFKAEFRPLPGSTSVNPEELLPLIDIKAAHHGSISNARISPDGEHILFADNQYPRIVNTSNGDEVFRLNRSGALELPVMEFSPDGEQVFIFNTFYETATGTPRRKYTTGNSGHYYSLAFSRDGKKFVLGNVLSQLFIWFSVDSDKPDHVFRNQPENNIGYSGNYNIYVAFLENDTKALSVRHTGEVFIWDIASGTMSQPFVQKNNTGNLVSSVAHSGDEKYIVFCNYGMKTVFLRDLKTGRLVKTFNGHEDTVLDVTFSPDSRFMLTGSADKTARLWDVESGKCVKEFEGHTAPVCSVSFSSDGNQFLTGSEDGTAILWE